MADLVEPEDEQVKGLPPGGLADPVDAKAFQKHQFHLTDWLLGVTVALTVGVAIAAWRADPVVWEPVNSQIGFLLTPFHTLLGIAVGYFFATKRDK
jgi:uncharacterized protein YneF (UPF0154 family)